MPSALEGGREPAIERLDAVHPAAKTRGKVKKIPGGEAAVSKRQVTRETDVSGLDRPDIRHRGRGQLHRGIESGEAACREIGVEELLQNLG